MTTPTIQEPGNQRVSASATPTGLSSAAPIEPASPSRPEASIPSRFHSDALYALVNWAEAHSGDPDPEFCEAIHATVAEPKAIMPPDYVRSVDAAVSLLPDGAVWRKYTDPSASVYGASPYNAQAQVRYDGNAATTALQIVAAHFRMMAAKAAARERRS